MHLLVVERYEVDPGAADTVPEKERQLFLALGHFANEVNLLQKLVVWAGPVGPSAEPFLQAQITQTLVLFRLLAGKLTEAWELLRKSFFDTRLSQFYDGQMSPGANDALCHVKRYHSATNVIDRLRNDFAFHYSAEQLAEAVKHLRDDEVLPIYLSESRANTLYYASEMLANLALMSSADDRERAMRLDAVFADVTQLAGWWLTFIGGFGELFVARYRGYLRGPNGTFELGRQPKVDEVRIPWFLNTASAPKRRNETRAMPPGGAGASPPRSAT